MPAAHDGLYHCQSLLRTFYHDAQIVDSKSPSPTLACWLGTCQFEIHSLCWDVGCFPFSLLRPIGRKPRVVAGAAVCDMAALLAALQKRPVRNEICDVEDEIVELEASPGPRGLVISNCKNTTIVCSFNIMTSVLAEKCSNTHIVLTVVGGSVELVGCTNCTVTIVGRARVIKIDKCEATAVLVRHQAPSEVTEHEPVEEHRNYSLRSVIANMADCSDVSVSVARELELPAASSAAATVQGLLDSDGTTVIKLSLNQIPVAVEKQGVILRVCYSRNQLEALACGGFSIRPDDSDPAAVLASTAIPREWTS